MLRAQWNTGRKYTIHGQRMTAIVLEDGTVLFKDKDRMIDGMITKTPAMVFDSHGSYLTRFVDVAYAEGLYRHSPLVWEHRDALEWKEEA